MEKEGFRSEEEAKETGWLEVNAAGEKEAGQPSKATDLGPPDTDTDALPAPSPCTMYSPCDALPVHHTLPVGRGGGDFSAS